MEETLQSEIEKLFRDAADQVRRKYREIFGEEPRSKHKDSLVRRIAWRMQADEEADVSERVRQRAFAIANDADLRVQPPRQMKIARYDTRIPQPGTILNREFRGNTVCVKVLPKGFEYDGRQYRSLSAIATEVAGTRWNGLAFFGLTGRKERKGKLRYAPERR